MSNFIICPVLLGLEMTARCVDSLLAQDIAGGVTPILIDNGSRDGCGSYLRSLHNVVLMGYAKPKGLSYLWNKSLSFVFDDQHEDHVLVVNNDLVLRPDTYRTLLEDGGQFVTGVSVGDAAQTIESDPQSRSPHPSFSCFMLRRSVWETVGRFDEAMVTYASDGDYHLRMDLAGIDAYAIALPFLHQVSGTLKNADPELADLIHQQADRDRAAFRTKWKCDIGSDAYYQMFRQKRDNHYAATGRLA